MNSMWSGAAMFWVSIRERSKSSNTHQVGVSGRPGLIVSVPLLRMPVSTMWCSRLNVLAL